MCFVNKMDRIGADFFAALESIKDRLNAKVAVIQLPIGAEAALRGHRRPGHDEGLDLER